MDRTGTPTPGPWTYSVEDGETLLGNGTIVVASFRDGDEPGEADARLIAQAPALLDVLRTLTTPRYGQAAQRRQVDLAIAQARALLRAVEGA